MRIKSLCLIGFCTLSLIACSKEKPAPQDAQANQTTSEATINHQATVEKKEFDPEKRIILHCASGGRSALAAKTLTDMGYKNIAHMDGGIKAWKEAGYETESMQ